MAKKMACTGTQLPLVMTEPGFRSLLDHIQTLPDEQVRIIEHRCVCILNNRIGDDLLVKLYAIPQAPQGQLEPLEPAL